MHKGIRYQLPTCTISNSKCADGRLKCAEGTCVRDDASSGNSSCSGRKCERRHVSNVAKGSSERLGALSGNSFYGLQVDDVG